MFFLDTDLLNADYLRMFLVQYKKNLDISITGQVKWSPEIELISTPVIRLKSEYHFVLRAPFTTSSLRPSNDVFRNCTAYFSEVNAHKLDSTDLTFHINYQVDFGTVVERQ